MTIGDVQPAAAPESQSVIDAVLAQALADEMVALTVQLGDLAYDLGSEPETLRRHMASLQAVDAITQGQLALAGVLRSTGPAIDRIAAVTLDELRVRLIDRVTPATASGG